MENAQVTFDLGWLISVVFLPIGYFMWKRISELSKDLTEHKTTASTALADYKLVAADKFASVGHLQEVEGRLVGTLDELKTNIKDLTQAMNRFIAKMGD